MEKQRNTAMQKALLKQSIHGLVRQTFAGWLKRQTCNCEGKLRRILEKLQDIEELIEIVARQVARRAKQGE